MPGPGVARTTATEEEEEPGGPALKAATKDPEGTFTLAAAEAGLEGEEEGSCKPGGGRDKVSATTFCTPEMWRISEVYSAT